MKYIIGILGGTILTFSGLYLYNLYYIKVVAPQKLANWYVTCLAEVQNQIARKEMPETSNPLHICNLFDDQIKEIRGE